MSKHRPKNVPKMVPGASPGPPRGLPEASLGPPGAILEDMRRNAKKQETQKVSLDPICQKNVKFTDPGWTPKSSRSGPESEHEVKNDVLFDATVGVTVLGGFFHRFSINFSCLLDALFLVSFDSFEKWKSA